MKTIYDELNNIKGINVNSKDELFAAANLLEKVGIKVFDDNNNEKRKFYENNIDAYQFSLINNNNKFVIHTNTYISGFITFTDLSVIIYKILKNEEMKNVSNKSNLKHPGNYKIWIGDDPKLCAKVQKKLFELGYKWECSGQVITQTYATALYLNGFNGDISYSTIDDTYFMDNFHIEITPQNLGINNSTDEIKEFNQYKIGDNILILDHGMNDTDHPQYKKIAKSGDIIKIDYFSKQINEKDNIVAISTEGHVVYLEEYPHNFIKSDDIEQNYLKIGHYYKYKIDDDSEIIFKWGERGCIHIGNSDYYDSDSDNNIWGFDGLRLIEASTDESIWFDKCQKNDKFIPQKKAIISHTLDGLVKDKIYAGFNQEGDRKIIFKYKSHEIHNITYNGKIYCNIDVRSNFIINNRTYLKYAFSNMDFIYIIREATFSEKQWLEACIFEGKFIPQEEAEKNYKYDLNSGIMGIKVDNPTKIKHYTFDIESLPSYDNFYNPKKENNDFKLISESKNKMFNLNYPNNIDDKYLKKMFGDKIHHPIQNIYHSIDPIYFRPIKKKTIKDVLNGLTNQQKKDDSKIYNIKLKRKKRIF